MATVHSELLALLRQWRTEIDAEEPALAFDVAALRARQRAWATRWPSIAPEVCEIRDAAVTATAVERVPGHPDVVAPESAAPIASANSGQA